MKKIAIPASWVSIPFTDILDISGGTQPPKKVFVYEPQEGYIRLLQIRDFGKKPVPTYIPNTGKLKLIEENDVSIARYGASIGRILTGHVGAINVAIAKVKIPNNISRGYIYWLLKSHIFQSYIRSLQRTAQNGFNKTDLGNLPIPLPPLAEQKRIVEKLDKFFGHLDVLNERLDKIPKLLKDFRQSVLSQAVSGELTAAWREGKEFLALNFEEYDNPEAYEILSYQNSPKTWSITTIGSVASSSRGKFTARPRNDPQYFTNGTYPFMQIGDLPKQGGDCIKYSKTLNDLGIAVSKSFPKNTVVIAIVGATIGKTGILSREMYFPDSLVGIDSGNITSNLFINYFLRVVKYSLREISYAGGGQPNIKLPTIRNLIIGIPPLLEQKEIVRRVESLFAKADTIEQRYTALKEKIDHLPQALLAKAFRGELVPQLSGDGDAQELLEEIKRVREEMGGKSKKK